MVMAVAMSPPSRRKKQQQHATTTPSSASTSQQQQEQQQRQQRSRQSGGGGFLGKLLLPSYTDAGASTAYQPQQHQEEQGDNDIHRGADNDDGDDRNLILPADDATATSYTDIIRSPDTFSEAATEIHDNRSRRRTVSAGATPSITAGRLIAASSLQLSIGSLPPPPPPAGGGRPSQSSTSFLPGGTGSGSGGNVTVTGVVSPARPMSIQTTKRSTEETTSSSTRGSVSPPTPSRLLDDQNASRYSFFPSTKPSPTPSPIALSSDSAVSIVDNSSSNNNDNNHHHDDDGRNSNTTNSDLGGHNDVSIHHKNDNRGKTIPSSLSSSSLLACGKLPSKTTATAEADPDAVMPPPRVNRMNNNIHQQPKMERSSSNVAVVLDDTDDNEEGNTQQERAVVSELTEDNLTSAAAHTNSKNLSIWRNDTSLSAAPRMNQNAFGTSGAACEGFRHTNTNDGDDDILSQVSSTASEMGTVINMGEEARAARMAEIDAMAAAMDDNHHESNDISESRQQQNDSKSRDSMLDDEENENGIVGTSAVPLSLSLFALEDSGLTLPTLESKSFDQPSVLPANRRRLAGGHDQQWLQQQRLRFPESVSSFDETISRLKTTRLDDVNDSDNDAVSASTAGNGVSRAAGVGTRQLRAAEIVSATLRRIGNKGTGLGSRAAGGVNTSLSAPNTPKASYWPDASHAHDLIRATLTPKREQAPANDQKETESQELPSSFALRSPGSLARYSLQKSNQKRKQSKDQANSEPSSRFSSFHPIRFPNDNRNGRRKLHLPTREHRSNQQNESNQPSSTKVSISPGLGVTQTFQIAQKCFSFDTTLDDHYSVAGYNEEYAFVRESGLALLKPRLRPLEEVDSPPSHAPQSNLYSRSWDGGNGSTSFVLDSRQQIPFRRTPAWRVGPSSTRAESGILLQTNAHALASESIMLRGRISSDFSPSRYSKEHATVELKTPHRLEIEREDALDILSCLVERGTSDWNSSVHQAAVVKQVDRAGNEQCSEIEGEETNEECGTSSASVPTESEIIAVADEIRALSKDIGEDVHAHARRLAVLDELVRSHAYAMEMKRASASASTWLKSIGRGDFGDLEVKGADVEGSTSVPSPDRVTADFIKDSRESQDKYNESQTMSESKMELATLRAMLHNAQFELAETQKANKTLNEELSTCRAEIGRLKTFNRNDHLDRSILDESHDTDGSTVTGLSDAISKDGPVSPIQRSRSDIDEGNRLFDVSNLNNTGAEAFDEFQRHHVHTKGCSDSNQITAVMKALDKANATIRRLHTDLQDKKRDQGGNEAVEAPVVNIEDFEEMTIEDLKHTSSSSSSEHRTVNVRMLDAENFTTDWMDLRPPLPPPPDHGLHSPIVDAVLEQWTDDRYMHQSLIAWIEEAMKGDNLESLPPLTISSLDHQVRDGFVMHILPLLLRRADIHVAVQTRAHRLTTYDMSVTVTQKPVFSHQKEPVPQPSLLDRQDSSREFSDQWMDQFEPRPSATESVAHSSITDAATNTHRVPTNLRQPASTSPLGSPPEEEYSSFATQLRMRSSSCDYSQDGSIRSGGTSGQGGTGTIMGALGGAISGLLSRNKYALSPGHGGTGTSSTFSSHRAQISDPRESNTMRNSLKAELDLTSSPVPTSSSSHYRGSSNSRFTPAPPSSDEKLQLRKEQEYEHPYHRVVSAPPGRIGVTFVEFRGHAMVSDVAADSPLSGWVFPSDVLIAVDEVAVSGMRVRDIVKIMSDRKDRSRALRMVSSHDMNEFTSAVDTSELKVDEND